MDKVQHLGPMEGGVGGGGWGQTSFIKPSVQSTNQQRFGLRLSCIHGNKLGKRGQLQDSFLSLICYIESWKKETKKTLQSQQSQKFGWTANLSEGVTCTVYTRERGEGRKNKKTIKVRSTSSVTIISKHFALQVINEQTPEEPSDTLN